MDKITLSYGSGGRLMHGLIDSLFMKELGNDILRRKKDSAIVNIGSKKIAFTTDSYVVSPLFFPGGDIGSLSVYGTVNDLSVCGAKPLFISLGLIIEEGLDRKILERITRSIKNAARLSDVKIVTGDTKVVGRSACDKIFINTSGIGQIYSQDLSIDNIIPGDIIIVSGTVGDHAISVLSQREGIKFGTKIMSDSAPLNGVIEKVLSVSGNVKFMRDPTRGGLATTLNEVVSGRRFGIVIDEETIPVKKGVRNACELLGFDPIYLACEGRFVCVVGKKDADKVLNVIRKYYKNNSARIIGKVTEKYRGRVCLKTFSGEDRFADMMSGEQLPRIC